MFSRSSSQPQSADILFQQALLMIKGDLRYDYSVEKKLQTALQLKHPLAAGELGIHLFNLAETEAQYKKAYGYLLHGMNDKHLLARLYYAYCCYAGLGCSIDKAQAALNLERFITDSKDSHDNKTLATQLVDKTLYTDTMCLALNALATMYARGEGVPMDSVKAISLLLKSMTLGSKTATFNYAILTYNPAHQYDPQNKIKRFKIWYQKLSELSLDNDTEAQYLLGFYHAYGKTSVGTIKPDPKKAEILFWQAGLGGKFESFYNLALLYFKLEDKESGLYALKLAAMNGVPDAIIECSERLCEDENTGTEDKIIALRYLKSVAKTPNARAKYTYAKRLIKSVADGSDSPHRLAEAFDYLRESAKTFQLAKLELAEALCQYPGETIELAFAEARHLLTSLITYPVDSSSVLYESLIAIQQQASELQKQLPFLEKKAQQLKNDTTPLRSITPKRAPRKIIKRLLKFPALSKQQPAMVSPFHQAASIPQQPLVTPLQTGMTQLPKALPDSVIEQLVMLEKNGYCAYVVGGMARNIILQQDSVTDDVDIVTDAPITVVEKLFKQVRNMYMPNLCRFTLNGADGKRVFDVVHVPNLKDHLLDDALNRDYTINAIYVDARGKIFDPLGRSLQDLQSSHHQLQTILPLSESFATDPMRVLRYLHFLSCGLSGNYPKKVIVGHLQHLKEQFDTFSQNKSSNEAIINEKVAFAEKIDSLMCKYFMNGKAAKIFSVLLEYDFFTILFHGTTFDSNDINWLQWRWQKCDCEVTLSKNRTYTLLIAAMLKVNTVTRPMVVTLLERSPFPVTLRWYTHLVDEIQIWLNEKYLFNIIPVDKHELLFARTQTELANISRQPGLFTKSTAAYLPGYQQLGQFTLTAPPSHLQQTSLLINPMYA